MWRCRGARPWVCGEAMEEGNDDDVAGGRIVPAPASAIPAPAAHVPPIPSAPVGFRRAMRKTWVDAMDDEDELVPHGVRRSAGSTARKQSEVHAAAPPTHAIAGGAAWPEDAASRQAGSTPQSARATNPALNEPATSKEDGSARGLPEAGHLDTGPVANAAQHMIFRRSSSHNETELSQARGLEGGRNWREGDSQPMDRVAFKVPSDTKKEKHWLAASIEALFQARWWHRAFLIFEDPQMEARFEEAWGQPDRLTLPLVLFSACWSLTYVQHKTIDSWLGNKLQLGIALAVLVVPTLTMLGCYNARATRFLRRNYHTAIFVNVGPPLSHQPPTPCICPLLTPPHCGFIAKAIPLSGPDTTGT